MQDNWQEFDRQMKSVLQDAGEKVPGRVWRAVSSRLDSAAASAALWWRWAVPAFVAAAVVAGLFLTGTFKPAGSPAGEVDILAQADVVPSADDNTSDTTSDMLAGLVAQDEVPAPYVPKSGFSAPVRRSGSVLSGQTGEPAAEVLTAEDPLKEENSAEITTVEDKTEELKTEEVKEAGFNTETAAQWARIQQEENRGRRAEVKLSGLYAQGSVGGNDSNLSYGGNGISRMAPGMGSAYAGISEAGQSTYGVPFTVGVGVRFHVLDKLSVGTGVDYSLLTRTFTGSYNGNSADRYEGSIYHSLQYVGVPVNVYYDLLKTSDNLINLYAWGGGEAEYCVSNRYRLMERSGSNVITDRAGGVQFSAALGLGMEFKLNDVLGLYADPSVRYYFHGNQPKSVRTDKPFMFNFDAGLRFNF